MHVTPKLPPQLFWKKLDFLLKNPTFFYKNKPKIFGRVVKTAFYVSRRTFKGFQISKKKFQNVNEIGQHRLTWTKYAKIV